MLSTTKVVIFSGVFAVGIYILFFIHRKQHKDEKDELQVTIQKENQYEVNKCSQSEHHDTIADDDPSDAQPCVSCSGLATASESYISVESSSSSSSVEVPVSQTRSEICPQSDITIAHQLSSPIVFTWHSSFESEIHTPNTTAQTIVTEYAENAQSDGSLSLIRRIHDQYYGILTPNSPSTFVYIPE